MPLPSEPTDRDKTFHDLVMEARTTLLGEPVPDQYWQGFPGMQEFGGVPSIRGSRWYDPSQLAQQIVALAIPAMVANRAMTSRLPSPDAPLFEHILGPSSPEDIAMMQEVARETSPARGARESWGEILKILGKGR